MSFATIALDPPWPERGAGKIKRGADRHYKLEKVPDIPGIIFRSGVFDPAPDCHMYMWATSNYLLDAGWVIEALGFRYIACVPWIKTGKKAGLGQYFRGKAEFLLFAVRGRGTAVRTDDKYVLGLIEAPAQKHSVKPQETYDLIERRSKGPYLEMFAREPRRGWTTWGDELPST